jgi:Transglutaminase-like superfamily/Coenzyme PQQ synthesis protein D (PqqD)
MRQDTMTAPPPLRLRSTGLHWRDVDGEIIALDGDASQYVAANGSGALLWHKLAQGTTRESLVDCLVETFGIDRGQATGDVDAFLASLRAAHLLESCIVGAAPDFVTARAALWALRAVIVTKRRLRTTNVRDIVVPAPPALPPEARRGVSIILRRRKATCLERALVLQRWLASQGVQRDVVIGVTGTASGFEAHAWLEGEAAAAKFHELTRVPYGVAR